MKRAVMHAAAALLAATTLSACSIMGGVGGHEIDKRSRPNDDFWASTFFLLGVAVDAAIIESELERRRAGRDVRELKREGDRIPPDASCDPDRERKVCSALEGCRCESTPK